MELKTLLITQARMGSERLPGKVFKTINGKTLLEIHIERLKECKNISQILIATTTDPVDDEISKKAIEWGVACYRGMVDDVLDRFYQAAQQINPEWIVRVTADCPLLDAEIVDAVIALARVNNVDYCTNTLVEHFPDGQDVEVFKFTALKKAWNEAKLKSEREHVTPYIRNNSNYKGGKLFTAINFPCVNDFSNLRMTVDELPDFELIQKLVIDLGIKQTWLIYAVYMIEKHLYKINANMVRNEGMLKSLLKD